MIITGVDFHPEFQKIAFVDTDTGELEERRLHHPGDAEAFYLALRSQGKTVRVGTSRTEDRQGCHGASAGSFCGTRLCDGRPMVKKRAIGWNRRVAT